MVHYILNTSSQFYWKRLEANLSSRKPLKGLVKPKVPFPATRVACGMLVECKVETWRRHLLRLLSIFLVFCMGKLHDRQFSSQWNQYVELWWFLCWQCFSHYLLCMTGIHQLAMDSPHKGPIMWDLWIPTKNDPLMKSFEVDFVLSLNNLLCK